MRVVVTGGAGAMAGGVLQDLLQQDDVSEIVVADISEEKARERVNILKDQRLVAQFVDLSDEENTTKLFKGAAVVINTALFATVIQATRAAAEAGVNYVDLGSPQTQAQLAFSDEFKRKGVTAVPGLGTAPGATNIMARYLVDKLDRVESIHLKDGNVDLNDKEHTRPLYWAYDIDGIMDEFGLDADPFLDGKITKMPGMSGEEYFTFHDPPGTVAIGYTTHPEPETMSQAFKDKGIRNVTWKIGFAPSFMAKLKFLCALGFNSREPINVKGQMVAPKDVLLELLYNHQPEEKLKGPDHRADVVVIAQGEEAHQRVEYSMSLFPSPKAAEAMKTAFEKAKEPVPIARVGVYAAIVGLMLARGQVKEKGAFPPELCIPAELFLKEASKRGHIVELNKKVFL
jgi:lysine 6-dehydrogenase